MKKSDLRSGMLVTLRNSKAYYVMLNTGFTGDQADVLVRYADGETRFMPLSEYDEDMTFHEDPDHIFPNTPEEDREWDIVMIEGTVSACWIFMMSHYRILWKREEDDQ